MILMHQTVQEELAAVVKVAPLVKMAPLKVILVVEATPVPAVKVTLVPVVKATLVV